MCKPIAQVATQYYYEASPPCSMRTIHINAQSRSRLATFLAQASSNAGAAQSARNSCPRITSGGIGTATTTASRALFGESRSQTIRLGTANQNGRPTATSSAPSAAIETAIQSNVETGGTQTASGVVSAETKRPNDQTTLHSTCTCRQNDLHVLRRTRQHVPFPYDGRSSGSMCPLHAAHNSPNKIA